MYHRKHRQTLTRELPPHAHRGQAASNTYFSHHHHPRPQGMSSQPPYSTNHRRSYHHHPNQFNQYSDPYAPYEHAHDRSHATPSSSYSSLGQSSLSVQHSSPPYNPPSGLRSGSLMPSHAQPHTHPHARRGRNRQLYDYDGAYSSVGRADPGLGVFGLLDAIKEQVTRLIFFRPKGYYNEHHTGNFSLYLNLSLLLSFFFITCLLMYLVYGGRDHHHMQNTTFNFLIPCTASGFVCLCDLIASLFTHNEMQRRVSILSSTIHFICTATYLILSLDLSPSFIDQNDREVFPIRYIEWSCSTPLIFILVAELSHPSLDELGQMLACNFMMTFMGFLACVVPGWGRHVCLLFSIVCFLGDGLGLLQLFRLAALTLRGLRPSLRVNIRGSLFFLFVLTAILWTTFPVIWMLAAVHWITPNIENFAYFLCDISSKLVLTAGIQSCNFVHLHGIMKERELTLQTASKQKSDFFSYIFHEVRVPLNAVALGVDELSSFLNSNYITASTIEEQKVTCTVLSESIMHVSKILSDVLLMQKAEEHQFTLEIAPFSMQECVQQTLRMMTSWVENKQITLVLDVAELPLVLGDRFRVRQVIANFLSNALKFTPNGGEILVASQLLDEESVKQIDFKHSQVLPREGTIYYIRVSVKDTGPGIDEETCQHVFNPYYSQNYDQGAQNTLIHNNSNNSNSNSSSNTDSGDGSFGDDSREGLSASGQHSVDNEAANHYLAETEGCVNDGDSLRVHPKERRECSREDTDWDGDRDGDKEAHGSSGLSGSSSSSSTEDDDLTDGMSEEISDDKTSRSALPSLPTLFSSQEGRRGKGFRHGTGLGLSICASIVELAGGVIGVNSKVNEGSEFYFVIPFQLAEQQLYTDSGRSSSSVNGVNNTNSINNINNINPINHINHINHANNTVNHMSNVHAGGDGHRNTNGRTDIGTAGIGATGDGSKSSHASANTVPGVDAIGVMTMNMTMPMSGSGVGDTTDYSSDFTPSHASRSSMRKRNLSSHNHNHNHSHNHNHNHPSQSLSSSATSPTPPSSSALRILVVDDIASNRRLLTRALIRNGMVVTQAINGTDAICKVLSLSEDTFIHPSGMSPVLRLGTLMGKKPRVPFDLILMDSEMPLMNGYEATRLLRKAGVTTPIFGVTGLTFASDHASFIEAGVDFVMTKPVDIARLLSTIRVYTTQIM